MPLAPQISALATRIASEIKSVKASITAKADDATVVHRTGVETVAGRKLLQDGLTMPATATAGATATPSAGEVALFVRDQQPTVRLDSGTERTLATGTWARVATTGNIDASGPQLIDGVMAGSGTRVLVRAQNNEAQNGVYIAANSTWSRAPDADTAAKLAGLRVQVMEGTRFAGTVHTSGMPTSGTVGATAFGFTSMKMPLADGTAQPPATANNSGATYVDKNTLALYINDGTTWQRLSEPDKIQATAPTPTVAGYRWYDTSQYAMKMHDGTQWYVLGLASVRVASTANISPVSGTPVIDGVQVAIGDAVLLKDQASNAQNGVWVVQSGTWSRASGFNQVNNVRASGRIGVREGTTNANTSWELALAPGGTVGSSPMLVGRIRTSNDDMPWTVLPSNVTGAWGIQYRVVAAMVTVIVEGSFATTSGTTHNLSTSNLPAAYCPPVVARTGGYFSTFPGTAWVSSAGQVSCLQQSGAARATVAFTITYPMA